LTNKVMYKDFKIGTVVLAYNVGDRLEKTVRGVPGFVDRVYVVDDGSRDNTAASMEALADRGVSLIRHERNMGPGAAMATGCRAAFNDGMDIVIKIDGDGQMSMEHMESLINPIVAGEADYTKGDRISTPGYQKGIPGFRLFGNRLLTVLSRISSGYWSVNDTQNGYVAISRGALEDIDIDTIYHYYGYLNDILVRLNARGYRIRDVAMPAKYDGEKSSIRLERYIFKVSLILLTRFVWRLQYKFFHGSARGLDGDTGPVKAPRLIEHQRGGPRVMPARCMKMAMAVNNKPGVTVITGWTDPEKRSIVDICTKILNILAPFSRRLTWLGTNLSDDVNLGDNINVIRLKSKFIPRRESPVKIIPYMLLYQMKVAWHTLRLLPANDVFIFALGSDLSFIPMLLVKLARKKLILRSDGRPSLVVKKYFKSPGRFKLLALRLIEGLSYRLADRILPENQELAVLYDMQKYESKLGIGSQYVDTGAFKETRRPGERKYDVGFIGRLIPEKGARQFAKALPLILKYLPGQAIIIGNGALRDEIERVLADSDVQDRVESVDWVENRSLPHYLNDIRLVVVPSDYEGLSNLVLEAMACGTLVLATAVGGTPGVVREGETGFLLEDNSPECIAGNVIRVLRSRGLDKIRVNARNQINERYSYPAAVARYRDIFQSLGFDVETSLKPAMAGMATEMSMTPDPERG
jgi:glycosyltransferase involved in cell wall biosynthesis